MSATGNVLDAIAAHARVALGLAALDARVEREIGQVGNPYALAPEQMPHGWVHSPARRGSREVHEQIVNAYEAAVLLVVDGTQEAALLVQEALEARIVADPRLGGLVIGAFVAQSELIEEFGRERRAIAAVVSWRTEV